MSTATNNTRTDIYTRVTSRIIEEFERGTRPWLESWPTVSGDLISQG